MDHLNEEFSSLVMQLTELGLTKYESLSYLAVITNGESSAKQISQFTGVPYGKVYEVINALVRKGFLNIATTKPLRCNIVKPKEALSSMKTKMIERVNNVEDLLSQKLGSFLIKEKKDRDVSIIEGSKNIYKKVLDLCNSGSSLHLCGHSKILRKIISQIDSANKNDAIAKVIILRDENDLQKEIDTLKNMTRDMLKCKTETISSPSKVCILSDSKNCLVIEQLRQNYLYSVEPIKAVFFSNSSLAEFLSANFLSLSR